MRLGWFLLTLLALTVIARPVPILHQHDSQLSAEEIKRCRTQAHYFFENPMERLLAPHFTVHKENSSTYYVKAYYHGGFPYDGVVMRNVEPYDEAKYAGKRYVEDRWYCEGSGMTRVSFNALP